MKTLCLPLLVTILVQSVAFTSKASERPNILWLTAEDIGPDLGCYGNSDAVTPHLDGLAQSGVAFRHVWSNAPVCAPARTTLISGMYPISTGSEHMRSLVSLPEGFQMFPQLLRESGYYCVNPGKEDYNLQKPGKVWDDIRQKRLWQDLKAQQPFMAVLNFNGTHESKIRTRPHERKHDPDSISIPPYHPDTPEVRQDWAQYHDNITDLDDWIGQQLSELENQGLAENTIVFFFGDHGSGMPRHKRSCYDSGLRVPLIIKVPSAYQKSVAINTHSAGWSDQLVSFVDLAPTVLSIAEVKPPEYLQGQAFLGKHQTPAREFVFGFRGRMDDRYDLQRSVRSERYVYIRNFMPHLPHGQHVSYMFETPTTQKWFQLFQDGKLNDTQARFWQPKEFEELYDLEADPHEICNLAKSSDHVAILEHHRQALKDWIIETRDVGFLPEYERKLRSKEITPYELGHSPDLYPLEKILETALLASNQDADQITLNQLIESLQHPETAVRYWGAMGLLMRGEDACKKAASQLNNILSENAASSVQIVAAEVVAFHGSPEEQLNALNVLVNSSNAEKHGPYLAMLALNALDRLGTRTLPVREHIRELPAEGEWSKNRGENYLPRLISKILVDLDAQNP